MRGEQRQIVADEVGFPACMRLWPVDSGRGGACVLKRGVARPPPCCTLAAVSQPATMFGLGFGTSTYLLHCGVAVAARSWFYLVARAGFQLCFISLYLSFSVDLCGIHARFACKLAFLCVVGIGRFISQSSFCVVSPRGPPGAPSVLSVTLAVEDWVCSQNQNEKLHTFTWKTCSIHGLRT